MLASHALSAAVIDGVARVGVTLTIDILNFVLLLEYLEADFYNINVVRFYP
jgi:energy-converting hydrogenase Eha subunit H